MNLNAAFSAPFKGRDLSSVESPMVSHGVLGYSFGFLNCFVLKVKAVVEQLSTQP